jgi:hypothetical protein
MFEAHDVDSSSVVPENIISPANVATAVLAGVIVAVSSLSLARPIDKSRFLPFINWLFAFSVAQI